MPHHSSHEASFFLLPDDIGSMESWYVPQLADAPAAAAAIYHDQNNNGGKISDAVTYGPRFCHIFNEFSATIPVPVNTDRPLMSLCLDYLIPFCSWARKSDAQVNSIHTTLLNNDYLRPEVRNGIVVVLMYTFAAVKAIKDPTHDMFHTMQDAETGLAIVNKFSLKIYNDPLQYLSFLKTCISALIDAGTIPDNERVNQPKRGKVAVENREEIDAFEQIKNMLITLLDAGNHAGR